MIWLSWQLYGFCSQYLTIKIYDIYACLIHFVFVQSNLNNSHIQKSEDILEGDLYVPPATQAPFVLSSVYIFFNSIISSKIMYKM